MSATEALRFGPYRTEGMLGRGAMGVVYRAVDERDGQKAAVKTIARELLANADAHVVLDRFQREAAIGMRLDHPGIVRVLGYGEVGDTLYLAMELVAGQDLAEVMKAGPALFPGDGLHYVRQLLDALGYAHAHGIVHRDVKPANALVDTGRRLRLMDFGIARIANSDLTQSGEMLGSPSHMAPEQIMGEPVDQRTDLFAAGVILYTMLAQQRPFNGAAAAVMYQVLRVDPPPPSTRNPECPETLDGVVARALAKRPDERFADAAAFARALDSAMANVAPSAAPGDADATVVMAPGARPEAEPTVVTAVGPDRPADAERLAEVVRACLAGTVSEGRLHRASALLEALTSGTAAGDPANADALRRLIDEALPALVDRILADYPAPGAPSQRPRPDWIATVRLFVLLRGLAEHLGAGATAQALTSQIASRLLGVFLGYSGTLSQRLFADEDPDVMAISMDLMRLDVLQLALDELGAAAESRHARDALRTFAGQIMIKANAILGVYLTTRDDLARFGVANLLAAIEELITIAERLFGFDEAAGMAGSQFAAQAAIRDFTDKAGQLVELVIAELEPQVGRPADIPTEFAHRLEQVGLIYAFATRVRDPETRDATSALVARVRGAVDHLTGRLHEALGPALDPELDGRIALAQMNAVLEFADRFGWSELRDRILDDLRVSMIQHPELVELADDDQTLRQARA